MKQKTGRKLLSFLLSLALVLGLMPGMSLTAYADNTEGLLTTITATAKEQASYSTEGVATVSFSCSSNGSSSYVAAWGWWGYGLTITVTPADGYTITKCVFYANTGDTLTDDSAPFSAETTTGDKIPVVNGTQFANTAKGISKIEVYGYATPATVAVTGVSLNKTSATLTVGGTETLTATVSPENATDKSVKWTSDNESVATVVDGVVTAVAAGTANITATSNADSTKTATCAVTVKAAEPEEPSTYTITIPATPTVANSGWNATSGISATGTLASGKKLTVTASSANGWALKSGDNSVGYKLATASSDTQATTSWEFDSLSDTATTKPMGIIVENYSNKPAGTYTDTVTFTASVEEAKKLYSITLTGEYSGKTLVVEYYEGDTWNDMVAKYSDTLQVISGHVQFSWDGFVYYEQSGSLVLPTAQIDPNETYIVE